MSDFHTESLPSAKILVVEDDADSRTLMKRALESEDFEVMTAPSGQEALRILEADPMPQLVLLDISMPKMSGEEFIQQLRANPRLSTLTVVLVSGWDDIAMRANDLGVAGYIRKPIELRTLGREVLRHLNK